MRRAARRDANEPALIELARRLGVLWEQAGPLDGWAYKPGRGWHPVEIKAPSRQCHANEYEASQVAFFERCRHRGAPYVIWRTDRDVFDFAGARRTA